MNLFTPLNLTLLAILIVATIAGFVLIPNGTLLPVHWQLSGLVDASLPRNFALIQMPIATLAVWVIAYAINRWGNAGRGAGAAFAMRIILPGLTTLFTLIQLVIVLIGLGVPLPFFHTV